MTRRHPLHARRRPARGLGAVAAVMVLVLLATLAAAIVRLGWTEQVTFAQDVDSARAHQTASAGIQWGLYQVLRGSWSACATATQTLDLRSQMGHLVTVTCTYDDFSEGETAEGAPRSVRVYSVTATACNGASVCPDSSRVGSAGYVERKRVVQVTN